MGYVYALQFDDLSIKVGQAGDADKRIARHKAEAARFGHRVIQVWSAKVPRPSATEGRLIDYCLSHGTARPGTREYFTGVPWDSEVWDKVSARTPPAWDRVSHGTPPAWDRERWVSRGTAGQVVPGTPPTGQRDRLSLGHLPRDSGTGCPWDSCPANTHAIIWDEECPSRDLCHQVRKIN
jgi:hypothetical protein